MKDTEIIKDMLFRLFNDVSKHIECDIQYEPITIVSVLFSGYRDGDIDIFYDGKWCIGDYNNITRGELYYIEKELNSINN